ncbi:E3 ubiquitin-protein ligase RMA1H1 [Bienertia sinuspersici]
MEQCFQQRVPQSNCCGNDMTKCKSPSVGAVGMVNTDNRNPSSGFDCNICLDFVQDPVVTLCGHLYCWPCIYRWMQSQRNSFENSDQQSQCPVCKTQVSQKTLIPLYGRGQTRKPSTKLDVVVPQRPSGPGCGVHTLITATTTRSPQLHYRGYQPHQQQQLRPYYSLDDYQSPAFGLAGTTTYNPMISMFGEMIYSQIFGNSQTTLYSYPNTYSVVTTSNARARRHVMQVDRSLSRVSFFFCCCIILCLLLF